MNKRNLIILLAALLMIGGTAFGINQLRTHQKLTPPGIVAMPIPGSPRLDLYLPERVLDYASVEVTDTNTFNGLPPDTSITQRRYSRPNDNWPMWLNVVLMGTDRTSIHKPEFCLRGQGWEIDGGNTSFDTVRMQYPHPYDLSVMKVMNSKDVIDPASGKQLKIRGIYVYWFVADNDLTAAHSARMRKTAMRLLRTGELERWAYVSCLGICLPGDEAATYERMKKFIATAVPKFQKATNPPVARQETTRTAAR